MGFSFSADYSPKLCFASICVNFKLFTKWYYIRAYLPNLIFIPIIFLFYENPFEFDFIIR